MYAKMKFGLLEKLLHFFKKNPFLIMQLAFIFRNGVPPTNPWSFLECIIVNWVKSDSILKRLEKRLLFVMYIILHNNITNMLYIYDIHKYFIYPSINWLIFNIIDCLGNLQMQVLETNKGWIISTYFQTAYYNLKQIYLRENLTDSLGSLLHIYVCQCLVYYYFFLNVFVAGLGQNHLNVSFIEFSVMY